MQQQCCVGFLKGKMKIVIIPDQSDEEYGIYGNHVQQKGDPDIMAKSQQSIQERFGLNDTEDEPGYDGNGTISPFRDEN